MFGKRSPISRDASKGTSGADASSGVIDRKNSSHVSGGGPGLPRVPSFNRFGKNGPVLSDVGPRTESGRLRRNSSMTKKGAAGGFARSLSSAKLERAPSMKKLERSSSSLALEKGIALDPEEGAMFRSMSSQRKNRVDVFRHLSSDTAEKTMFQSKLKYEEILFELEETLVAQETSSFQRQKNTLWYSTKLKKGWHMGEIRVLEVIGHIRVEFRRASGCKVDYWTFVEYFRRFVRELKARVPEAVETRNTVRDQYRAQKASQRLQDMRQKALQVDEERSKDKPVSPVRESAGGDATSNPNESEYQRLQKMFQLEEDDDDDMHDLADVVLLSPDSEAKAKFEMRSSGREVERAEAKAEYSRMNRIASQDSEKGRSRAQVPAVSAESARPHLHRDDYDRALEGDDGENSDHAAAQSPSIFSP